MTQEERLELLKQIEKDIYVPSIESNFLDDAKSCAIHSIIEELEQEPSGDAISRQVVKEQMIKYGFHAPDMTVTEFIEDLPPVNPQEPRQDLQQAAERIIEQQNKWFKEQERKEQEPAYCDRNICLRNEYNGIGCDECEVTKNQEPITKITRKYCVQDEDGYTDEELVNKINEIIDLINKEK